MGRAAYSIKSRPDGESFQKSCFAETIDKHPILPWAATGYPIRNAKIGFEFEQRGSCLPRFCFASQMSQGGREAAIGRRKSLVLVKSFLRRGNRVIETTKIDECNAHFCKP